MAIYLVSYDLNAPGKDYSLLYASIKELSSSWWHYLDSTWFIQTELPPSVLRDKLRQVLDSTDRIIVIKVTLPWASYNLSDKAVQWLKNNT